MNNWKEHGWPFQDFNEEITKAWIEKGFDLEQTKKWLEVGALSGLVNIVAWLRDEKKMTPSNWKELSKDEMIKLTSQYN